MNAEHALCNPKLRKQASVTCLFSRLQYNVPHRLSLLALDRVALKRNDHFRSLNGNPDFSRRQCLEANRELLLQNKQSFLVVIEIVVVVIIVSSIAFELIKKISLKC